VKTLTAERAFQQVQETAEKVKNDETAVIGTMSAGDCLRQGDLFIVCLKSLPAKRMPTKNRQLAPGTSQGSRHVLAGDCEIFEADKEQCMAAVREALAPASVELHAVLMGPVFRTIGETTVEHPEHGWRVLPAGECFAVIYQRQFGEEVRRQVD
jgi:hypothetical protein